MVPFGQFEHGAVKATSVLLKLDKLSGWKVHNHSSMCVQRKLTRSVGDRPTEARVRGLLAWIAGRKETEFLKPIDEAILGMASESSGRN